MSSIKNKAPGRVKSAILNWLGVPIDLASGEFWQAWNNSGNAAGQHISEKSVMSLSAAWACTRLIAETGATLPLKIYERTPTGRRVATEHPLYALLHTSPNAYSSPVTFWESMISAIALRGNGFAERKELGGRLVSLDYLMPGRLSPKNNDKTIWYYTPPCGPRREIPWKKIFHIPGFSMDGRWGVSAISYGAEVFGSALASSKAANKTFENGLLPTVAFSVDRVVKKEQREDFRTAMEDYRGALNAGKSPVLEAGMKAEKLGIDPSDAQLLETRAFSVEEVCRWFRVDPSMVGHGGAVSNWGTGLEQKMIAFLSFTLRPWLVRIEQAINTRLIAPQDQQRYYAEFSIEGLLRGDTAARSAFYTAMVNNGVLTRDEVRAMENRAPRGGNADELTVQSAMTTIESIGQQNQGDKVGAALASWLGQYQWGNNEGGKNVDE